MNMNEEEGPLLHHNDDINHNSEDCAISWGRRPAHPKPQHILLFAILLAGAVVAVQKRGAGVTQVLPSGQLVEDESDGDIWKTYVDLLDQVSNGVKFKNVEYAQCYTGYCTKNDDGLTASCGCLSMRPSEENNAILMLGWQSAALIGSSVYREALKMETTGDSEGATKLLRASLNNASSSLYDNYGLSLKKPVSRISMFSGSNEYFSVSGDVSTCHDFSYAQCMGAPCFDRAYDSVWNTTCICPYVNASHAKIYKVRKNICSGAKMGGDCAAVAFDDTTSYTAGGLKAMIKGLKSISSFNVDSETCPCRETI